MNVVLTKITPDAELHCELAARDCYDSVSKMKDPTTASNLVKACTKAGHLTINGHAMATFRITGVTRAAMAQITRHRTACFSIRSQRYVSEENFEVEIPEAVLDNPAALTIYMDIMNTIRTGYSELIKCGIHREDARGVLPNDCKTIINMSMSFEGWLHFLKRRMDKKAQKEVKEMAFEIYRQLNAECPKIFNKETIMAVQLPDISWEEV